MRTIVRVGLLALCTVVGLSAVDLITADVRSAATAVFEIGSKPAAVERFLKIVRPVCSNISDAGIATTLLAIDVLLKKRTAADAPDQQLLSFLDILERSNETRLRGQAQRLRLAILQGSAAANIFHGYNDLLKTFGSSGRDSMEGAEIAFYFAQACLHFRDVDRAKESFAFAKQLRGASRYLDLYNGILVDRDFRELASAILEADQSEAAQLARWQEAERARIKGDWHRALSAYAWIAKVSANSSRQHDAAWRAYQCEAFAKGHRPDKSPEISAVPPTVLTHRAPLRATVLTEIALLIDYDLPEAEKEVIAGLVAIGAISVKGQTISMMPTTPIVVQDDVQIVADLYDRFAICRMVQSDFNLASDCLGREVLIRPPGKRPDGNISALDDLQIMCAAKRIPVTMPQLVMNGQRRIQLLLFLGGFQMYKGELADAGRLYHLVEADRKATDEQVICARYERAEIARLDGKLKEACDQWDEITKASPQSMYAAQSLHDAALIFAGRGDIPNSEQRLLRVLAEYPAFPERNRVVYNLGFIYYFSDDFRKAEVQFKNLLRQFPDTWEAQRVKRVELPAIAASLKSTPIK